MARDLHEDRLATTDESGRRVFLFPEEVRGFFRKKRNLVYWILIPIFLLVPWININGKQAFLLDIGHRQFTIFGFTFLGHDTPLFFFVLTILVFLIAGITTIFGRVWCGWACPQTVFIDAVYRKIEELIEGKARERKALDKAPWTKEKILKRIVKWGLYLIISLHLAHTFLGYFVPIRSLFAITMSPPSENWTAFITMMIATAITLFDFGWFREQFCIIACPYGKFQSVMMDTQSLVVAYDVDRGEPRRGIAPTKSDEGDCINCAKCVKVCPTGIDIRRGTQLECIACTACIDACDEIMTKVGKPTGLIRYTSEEMLQGKKWSLKRVRPIFYFCVVTILITVFSIVLNNRAELTAVFVRGTTSPYQVFGNPDGTKTIVNHYKIQLSYRLEEEAKADFELPQELKEKIQIVTAKRPFTVKPGKSSVGVFFRFPPEILNNGDIKVPITIKSTEPPFKILNHQEINLVGP